MLEQKRVLGKAGVRAILPDSDTDLFSQLTKKDIQIAKRRASMKHIRRIRDQKTYCILVVNLDKHGVSNYIGPNTFAEIAVALAHYKKVYLYQGVPEFYREELNAWQALCLDGSLNQLIKDFRIAALLDRQPTLFEL